MCYTRYQSVNRMRSNVVSHYSCVFKVLKRANMMAIGATVMPCHKIEQLSCVGLCRLPVTPVCTVYTCWTTQNSGPQARNACTIRLNRCTYV